MATKEISAESVPIAQLQSRKKEAEKGREAYDSTWERNWQITYGDGWYGIPKESWFSSETDYAKPFEFVEIMRSMLADNRWGLSAIPTGFPKDVKKEERPSEVLSDKSDKINKLLQFLWDDTDMQYVLPQVFIHMFTKGTGFLKPSFDPENISQKGIGQIVVEIPDPTYIYPDPYATTVDDASYIIQTTPVSMAYLRRKYPDKVAELIEKGAGTGEQDRAPRGSETASSPNTDEGKAVELWECWYYDESTVDEEDEGEIVTKKKFPNGRRTVMTANGVVLEDGENPYSRFPYIAFKEIPRPGEFWGGCTLDKVASLQTAINRVLRSIIDNGTWLVHGIWITDNTSGVSVKKLQNIGPRDVVVKNPGSEVRRESGKQLPPHIFELLRDLLDAFDRITGVVDILRGIAPSRQPVGTTLQQQESGEVRTRERARNVEVSLKHLALFFIDLVKNHWSDTRTIRSEGVTGGFDVFELSSDELEGWEWDVSIEAGSTLPIDRRSIFDKAIEMRNAGIPVPDSYIVRYSSMPGLEAAMLNQAKQMNSSGTEQAAAEEVINAPSEPAVEENLFPSPEEMIGLPPELMEGPQALP